MNPFILLKISLALIFFFSCCPDTLAWNPGFGPEFGKRRKEYDVKPPPSEPSGPSQEEVNRASREAESNQYAQQSYELHKQGRYKEAEEAARQAIRLNPQHYVAYNNLGWALCALGRYWEAEDAFRQALGINPNYNYSRKGLEEAAQRNAQARLEAERQDRREKAFKSVQPFIEASRLNEQGCKYYESKQWKLAVESYKAAMEKSPNDGVLRANYELALRQLATEQRKEIQKLQQAVNTLKAAIKKYPGNAEIHKNYEIAKADLEAKKGKLWEGRPKEGQAPSSSTASGPSPQNLEEARNLKERGDQYCNNKQWQPAYDAYMKAMEKNPGNAEIRNKCAGAAKKLAAEQRKVLNRDNPARWGIPNDRFRGGLGPPPLASEVSQKYLNRDYAAALAATVENRFLNPLSGKNTRKNSPVYGPIVFLNAR